MHGEYKVPGGKLVIVDFEVMAGEIQQVRVSGDFFLEPDDALDDINRALNGMPAMSDAETISQKILHELRPEAVLVGFSAEAVAIAMRRALTESRGWADYEWQIVHEPAIPPLVHLALDEVLANRVGSGLRTPTIRFWEWDESAIVIGSFQSVRNEVDLDAAYRHGFDVIRRISGGGAMMMEKNSVVTYSLYVPSALVTGMSFADSYSYLDDWVLEGLRNIGIEASYKPLNDIASPAGKIGGAAQKRLGNGGVLHHVTMSYDLDNVKMLEILRIGREKLSDKGIKSAAKRVDPLKSQTGLDRSAIIETLKNTFAKRYGAVAGSLTDGELAEAKALAESKFNTAEWRNRVP